MSIYDRMRNGEWIHRLQDEEYNTVAREEMSRYFDVCFRINTTPPGTPENRALVQELFDGRLSDSSTILPPMEIDRAKAMTVGENVFVNHGVTCMTSGGVTLEDGVMIGPEAALITAITILPIWMCCNSSPSSLKRAHGSAHEPSCCPASRLGKGPLWPPVQW